MLSREAWFLGHVTETCNAPIAKPSPPTPCLLCLFFWGPLRVSRSCESCPTWLLAVEGEVVCCLVSCSSALRPLWPSCVSVQVDSRILRVVRQTSDHTGPLPSGVFHVGFLSLGLPNFRQFGSKPSSSEISSQTLLGSCFVLPTS